jgi:lysophospholipase L1-like esterase
MAKALAITSCLAILAIVMVLTGGNSKPVNETSQNNVKEGIIRYVAVGDSYTIGLGVDENERWPNLLVKHLADNGIAVELVENLAVSGYTTRNAIEFELPLFEKTKPDFATLLIGANDSFQYLDSKFFENSLKTLLDRMQENMSNPKNIILITVPDHAKSAAGRKEGLGEETTKLVEEYNRIIKMEAYNRGLPVADIAVEADLSSDPANYIEDGLHPSAKGYRKWEKAIYPAVYNFLKK